MKSEDAKKIIFQNNLISGKISRRILIAIEENLPINSSDLPPETTLTDIEHLRKLYNKKLSEIGCQKYPRNLIFYHIIKETFPEFSWKFNVVYNKIEIDAPRIKNLRPSLLSLLLGRVNSDKDSTLHRKYRNVDKLPAHIVRNISDAMDEIDVIYPDEQGMEHIINWIRIGLSQQQLTIFSPLCPDYSVEPTGNLRYPFRHTFNELGSGLGLIAKRILYAMPVIKKALEKCGIEIKIIIGFGDFEAYSEANLERLRITKEEFLNRVVKSKKLFEDSISIDVNVCMITDYFGGLNEWLKIYEQFTTDLNLGNFGASQLTYEKLLKIVQKRKNLYDRWYGTKSLFEHIPQLLQQGAEYATLGFFISRLSKNCLVLGADNDAMGSFYSVQQFIPTLYLKRFYL